MEQTSDTTQDECSGFPGKFYDLCTGKGHDGRPDPNPVVANRFRSMVGLEPIPSLHMSGRLILGVQGDRPGTPKDDPMPPGRPGTKLKEIFESLGVKQSESCSCRAIEMEMNRLGVEGCEREAERLIDMIEQNAKRLSWWEKIRVGASGLAQGYMFNLSARGLFQEALRRAAEEAGSSTGQ